VAKNQNPNRLGGKKSLAAQLADIYAEEQAKDEEPEEFEEEFLGQRDLEAGKKANKARLQEDIKKAPEKRLTGTFLKEIMAAVERRKSILMFSVKDRDATDRDKALYKAIKMAEERAEQIRRNDKELKDLPIFPHYRGARVSIQLQRHKAQKDLQQLIKAILVNVR